MNRDPNYLVDMIVEIPYNSFVKYEFDKVAKGGLYNSGQIA